MQYMLEALVENLRNAYIDLLVQNDWNSFKCCAWTVKRKR